MPADPASLMILMATFMLAGAVKGVIGLGLPTISLGLLAIAFDLPTAMALLVVPSLVTNVWQGLAGGQLVTLIRRLWPFLLCATLMVWLGAVSWAHSDPAWLTALLGFLLLVYSALSLSGWRPQLSPKAERWSGPLFGVTNGVLTGMTGSFVVPGVLYLQAIRLPRDQLIQAMGILFSLSTLALAAALQFHRLLSLELAGYSSIGLIPALLGMLLGQKVRHALSEAMFRRLFFAALAALGAYILSSTALAL